MIRDFYNQPFPTLEIDDEIYLREQRISDTDDFFKYYSDPEVGKHILATNPTTPEEAKQEIEYCRKVFEQKRGIYWTIATKSDDRMIGAVGLYINNFHHRAELCYDLSQEYWRKKVMSRAINRVLSYAFLYMGIHRMEAVTTPHNDASIGLLERLGFDREGQLKNYRFYQGKTHNIEMFGMTPTMYFAKQMNKQKAKSKETV